MQVWCDQLPGMLDLNKMQVVPQSGQVRLIQHTESGASTAG